jgi:hypothetical protein
MGVREDEMTPLTPRDDFLPLVDPTDLAIFSSQGNKVSAQSQPMQDRDARRGCSRRPRDKGAENFMDLKPPASKVAIDGNLYANTRTLSFAASPDPRDLAR